MIVFFFDGSELGGGNVTYYLVDRCEVLRVALTKGKHAFELALAMLRLVHHLVDFV